LGCAVTSGASFSGLGSITGQNDQSKPPFREAGMKPISICLAISTLLIAQAAVAGDAENGKRIALARCASCHTVVPNQRVEIADSLPFDVIAEKFGANHDLLFTALIDSRQRMNVTITRREADDLAAYIGTAPNQL
jgi:mono/diheme cytochrome c family protein